ncbi:hypothetical protein TNCV_1309781 [Trichonephila clavipes]|nr:hypothetical protein TNCV_1309781 [Trichonephila clavipes]
MVSLGHPSLPLTDLGRLDDEEASPGERPFTQCLTLTIDELIEMYEQEQDIEEFESLDPVLSENIMTVRNLTEGLGLIEKGLQKFWQI